MLALGALVAVAAPRTAAAGGNFFFSFGFPVPLPVFAPPVVVAPPVVAYPAYQPYPYYAAPAYAPPVVAFGGGGYYGGGCARPHNYYRPGPYARGGYGGPPYGNAYGYRAKSAQGYRWR
jgi:hypothetical protein